MAGSSYTTTMLEASGAADSAFSPDQTRLYVSRSDGTIDVFDVASHTKIANWSIGSAAGALSVSEDGTFLLVVDPRQALLHRVDVVTGQVTQQYIGTGGAFLDVEIIDARTAIVSGGTSPTTLDLTTGLFAPFANGSYYGSRSILGEDSHLTLLGETGISSGPLALYDDRVGRIVARGDNYQTIGVGGGGNYTGFNYGAQAVSEVCGFVLQGVYPNSINIYDLSLKYVRSITFSGFDQIFGITVSDNGMFAYVASTSGTIVKYNTSTFNEVARYSVDTAGAWTGGSSFGNAMLISDDGRSLVLTNGGIVQLVSLAPSLPASSTSTLELSQSGVNAYNAGTLRGSPALHITAANVELTNAETGRIIGDLSDTAIVIDAAGSVINNLAGGIIRSEAFSGVAIRGSEGSDTVINAGLISGTVNLMGGADSYTDGGDSGGSGNTIDLGAGNDTYRIAGSQALNVIGGDGIDTVIVGAGARGDVYGNRLTGFEKLVVQGGINLQQFSGYQSITLSAAFTNFADSFNPLLDLAINAQDIWLYNSSLRSITGSSGAEEVRLFAGAKVGNVQLGGGNDRFNINARDGDVVPRFGPVDGGDGVDQFELNVNEGASIAMDLARITGFETVNANWSLVARATIALSNVVAPTSIQVGSSTTLTLRQSSTALLSGAFGGGVVLEAGTVVGRYGVPDGPYDSSVDLVQGDDRLSVSFINHATVQQDIKFYTGDDYYDGRDGSVGGTIYGNAGNDTILGGAGADRIDGGFGADILWGNGGNDVLIGGAGADTLVGGIGDDLYSVDRQADVVFENANEGTDTVISTGNFYLYANLENLTLATGAGNIFGVGNDLANTIVGNAGNNTLLGGGGADTIRGGAGGDILYGEGGADQLLGDADNDFLAGGAGDDTLDGGTGGDSLYGEDGNDTLTGGSDFVFDQLVGGAGDDVLRGDSGLGDFDYLYGNTGNDSFYVDTPADLVFEQAGEGTDTVYASINGAGYYLYANIENLVLLGNTPFGVGNALDNTLTGNATGNYLLGGGGNDVLNGKGGNDVLFGEAGSDTFVFERGTGGDVIGDFVAGTDKIDLSALGFTSFAQVTAALGQNGTDSFITFGNGDFVVLNGVAMSSLQAGDFVFASTAATQVQAPEHNAGSATEAYDLAVAPMPWLNHGLHDWAAEYHFL